MINPELKKRFVDSIEYLRKMDFFKDYSSLTSVEIFNKILNGEMDYGFWWEEWEKKLPHEPEFNEGLCLKRYLMENTSPPDVTVTTSRSSSLCSPSSLLS
ncbi:MAG: hypothetical protein FGF53_03255 [Candidatus Brockarchaeota archaeon]|nr:hypothetical protein [Candidatus Brockarchaeota archaeon]MBO3808307.1 hypothetical protein [Candidatus Brockarchaeota archaeon]MBS7631931.1 hypothetical protein [Candidatus Bathyarchaeota archaeon]